MVLGQRGIPREVQTFIRDHLTSLAQLEILLLLHREPSREFGAAEVAETLRIDPGWARSELSRLRDQRLFATSRDRPDVYCYRPASADDREVVDALARVFATHRVSVITLIFSTPSDSIGSFADAFKLRSNDDG